MYSNAMADSKVNAAATSKIVLGSAGLSKMIIERALTVRSAEASNPAISEKACDLYGATATATAGFGAVPSEERPKYGSPVPELRKQIVNITK